MMDSGIYGKAVKFDPIETAISDALNALETTVLPPDPLQGLKTKTGVALLMYKKDLAKAAQEREAKGLEPPPPWGVKINLANLCIGPKRCEPISRALTVNKTVTTLDLSHCDLTDEGGVFLGHCLERNSILQHLVLHGNFLTAATAAALAKCLFKPHCALETIAMSCNTVGDEGALALADAIRVNKTLTFLNLRANGITDVGARALLDAMNPVAPVTEANPDGIGNLNLTALWINMNTLSAEMMQSLQQLMVLKCPKPPDTGKKKKKGKGKGSPKKK